jgi:hypothetical protein
MLRRAQHDKNAGRPAPVEGRSWQRVFGLLLLLPILTACLGRATPPELVKLTQAQNEVLGKFARQVGERELNILLRDPNDTTLPGIPVGDLLYILSRVNEDKLIRLVKGISATTTLELILAIKRVGCTRYDFNYPGNGFDARILTGNTGMNACTWQHFHLPNIMVQLLNGVSNQGLNILIDTVRHDYPELGLPANQPLLVSCAPLTCPPLHAAPYTATVSHYAYLMKLAFIVAGFDYPNYASDPTMAAPNLPGPAKLFNLMNMTAVGRDMVFLLDSFDKNTCPGAPLLTSNCVYVDTSNVLNTYDINGNLWRDIQNGYQFQRLKNLLRIIDLVQDTRKMGVLLNGRRQAPFTTAQDEQQIRYYIDRLKVALEHSAPGGIYTCPVGGYPLVWPDFPAANITECDLQNYTRPQGPAHTTPSDPGDDEEWNRKLAALINLIPLSNMDRMMALVYDIEDGFDFNHTTAIPSFPAFPRRGIDNLLVLINNINNVDAHNPPNTTNNELLTAAYLIDNVQIFPTDADPRRRNKVKYLVEYIGNTLDVLQLACYTAVADHVDGVAPADPTPDTCDNRGLINQVADGSKLDDAAVTDLTAAGQKLANLADQINDIEDMRFLVRKVSMGNMTQIINGLQIASTINVANLVNQIQGQDCWNEQGGVIVGSNFNYGLGYAASVSNPGAAYTGNFVVNPLPGGSGALVKAIVETDAVNHPTFVGRVRAFVVTGSGTGYVAGTYNDGGGAAMTYAAGQCYYDPLIPAYRGFPTAAATGATGLGKLVNVINHITGSPGTIVTLVNGVTDGAKLGILINGINRSSNLVGVMNAVVDPNRNNNATINDLINLMNTLSRADVGKLVHIIENLGDAREATALLTVPSADHDLVAQLMAPYCRTDASGMASATCPAVATGNLVHPTSGIGIANLANLVGALTTHGGGGYTDGATIKEYTTGAIGQLSVPVVGGVTGIEVTNPGSNCSNDLTVSLSPPGGAGTIAQATPVVITNSTGVAAVNITDGGTGYSTDPNDPRPVVTFTSVPPCAVDPVATAHISGGSVTSVSIINSGRGCSPGMTVNFVGGVYTTAAQGTVVFGGGVQRVNILNSGSGYTSAPTVTFSGTCSTMPQATAYINGIGSIAVIDKGTIGAKVRSFNFSPGGAANITATVSGSINTTPGLGLVSIYGGSGYKTGDTCPITGAGGSGATCDVIESGGVLTGCSTILGGNNYASGRIVKIGGRASAVATVVAGGIAAGLGGPGGSGPGGIKIVNTGCGYITDTPPPVVRVVGCAVEPQANAVMTGSMATGYRVTDIDVTVPGTGCSSGAKVIIGDVISQAYVTANVVAGSVTSYTVHSGGAGYGASATATILGGHCTVQPTATVTLTPSPNESVASVNVVNPGAGCSATEPPTVVIIGDSYAPHADGATAIVDQVTGGYVSAMSVSDASVNAAQLVQLIDRDATGNGIAINYAYSSLAVGGISAREALVRLLHHGVTPQTHQSMSFYNGVLGATGPAGGVPGRYLRDWPGIGTTHIAGAILNNVDLSSTQTLINLINSNSTTLVDLNIMLGCGDRSQYSNAWTTFTWEQLCRESGPGLW